MYLPSVKILRTYCVAAAIILACSPSPTQTQEPDNETESSDTVSQEPDKSECTASLLVGLPPQVELRAWAPLPFVEPSITFVADSAPFAGYEPPLDTQETFTMVAADMDLDGDPDVLFNRHLFAPLELFQNDGGHFVQINRGEDLVSGLWDNPGIPELYVDEAVMLQAIASSGLSGLFVWHDASRGGMWRIKNQGDDASLLIEVDRPLVDIANIDPSLVTQRDDCSAEISAPFDEYFGIDNELTGTQLKVTVTSEPLPTIYIGRTLVPDTSGAISLWKNDPHGMAWVDVLGSKEPDIFVTRGGLTGLLLPPFDGKVDYLYEYKGGLPLFEQVKEDMLGRDYCRGRQTAWYDFDNDGDEELYVSCEMTPNKLLDNIDGGFLDRAPVVGLDLIKGDAFAVLDINGDACLDFVQNDLEALIVDLNDGETFVRQSGKEWGLDSPVNPEDIPDGIWNPFALHTFDFDRDGDLDLWASAFRDAQEVAVFRRDGDRFTDVTVELGLEDAVGFEVLIPADVDNDGWIDIIAGSSTSTVVWRNISGSAFVSQDLGIPSWMGVQADVDGDGRIDVIATAESGHFVLFNRTAGGGYALTVDVDAPLGSLVRGYYADGSVLLQQWGSADNNRYSQGILPLRFGVGEVPLVAVGLKHPGDLNERKRIYLENGRTHLTL
jgi:hypothetical protein